MSSSAETVRGWSMDLRILVTRTTRQHISVGCSSFSWWLQQTNIEVCFACTQAGDEESHNFGQKGQSQLRGWCSSGHLQSLLPSFNNLVDGYSSSVSSQRQKAFKGKRTQSWESLLILYLSLFFCCILACLCLQPQDISECLYPTLLSLS